MGVVVSSGRSLVVVVVVCRGYKMMVEVEMMVADDCCASPAVPRSSHEREAQQTAVPTVRL